jgi:signal transduction histidine kinase
VVALNPRSHFASGQPEFQAALEMAASLIALLAAFLAFGRIRRRRRLTDFALACALGVIALSNLSFGTVATLAGLGGSNFLAWSAVIGRTLGCMLFAVAAFVPSRRLRHIGQAQVAAVACMTGGLALLVLLGWLYAAHLPVAMSTVQSARSPGGPPLDAAPELLGLELLAAVVAALAVIGYLRRSRRLDDEFFGWLAVAAVFGSAAHLNYFLYPSVYADVFSVADAFRLCFYLVLLIGSMREIWSYWLALSEAMVVSERRRIACDLHDGLAQELAYLTRNLESLDGRVDHETLSRLRHATDRARLESQLAITKLAVADRPPVGKTLAQVVGDLAKRFDIALALDIEPDTRLSAGRSDALVHIACEALTNAARHSGAVQVSLSLERRESRVRLRVSDSGSGFDPAAPAAGFGLTSMRERARSVGGELRISSRPGHGTMLEAVL